jgi:hypothetical protein
MPQRWNGVTEQEKLSSQRQGWSFRKTGIRNDKLDQYDVLDRERAAGVAENSLSLQNEAELKAKTKELRAELKRVPNDDLKAEISQNVKLIESGQDGRRKWALHKKAIDLEMKRLKESELSGVRVHGRRKTTRRAEDSEKASSAAFKAELLSDAAVQTRSPFIQLSMDDGVGPSVCSDPMELELDNCGECPLTFRCR